MKINRLREKEISSMKKVTIGTSTFFSIAAGLVAATATVPLTVFVGSYMMISFLPGRLFVRKRISDEIESQEEDEPVPTSDGFLHRCFEYIGYGVNTSLDTVMNFNKMLFLNFLSRAKR